MASQACRRTDVVSVSSLSNPSRSGKVTYNRLWKDVRPPCRKRTLVRRNFASIRGRSEDYTEDAGTHPARTFRICTADSAS